MKRETERMLAQLQRAWNGDAWHGPAVLEVLEGVSAAQAARRPIPEAHSLWEIALHVATWEDAVARRLGGEKYSPSPEENFPAVTDTTEAAWAAARERLANAHRKLVAAVMEIEDEQLDEPAHENTVPRYIAIHGIIQHDLYHAGQMAILKKAGAARSPKPAARKPAKRHAAAKAGAVASRTRAAARARAARARGSKRRGKAR